MGVTVCSVRGGGKKLRGNEATIERDAYSLKGGYDYRMPAGMFGGSRISSSGRGDATKVAFMLTAEELIRLLRLEPLPREGGWYQETYRSPLQLPTAALAPRYHAPRSAGTAIYTRRGPE